MLSQNLKVDLNNVGKTRYLYHEIFQIKDFQEIKNNGKLDEYRDQLEKLKKAEYAYYDEGTAWGMIIFMLGTVVFPVYKYFPWLLLIPFTAFIARTVFVSVKYNRANDERHLQRTKTEELSESHPLFQYYYHGSGHYDYYDLVWRFNRLVEFLSKLDEYDDITVYKLNENLNYPTECEIKFRRLMFKDNNTNQFFTYAYNSRDNAMTMLTIFDIDIDTFEYKPRTV